MNLYVRNIEHLNFIRLILFTFLVSGLILTVSCGSASTSVDAESVAPASGTGDELGEISRVFSVEKLFTLDDFVTAGWKKSKQYDTETVPEAIDIWYGFYSGRDIEVRFYESYEVASTVGFNDAADVVDISATIKVARNAAGGSGSTTYKAFAVVGNTVMLCELAIESCIALVDALGVNSG
jgi:hypothetical protein